MRPFLAAAIAALLLSACGLKGDLYLAAPEPAATPTPAAEPPAADDDEEQQPRVPATPEPAQRR